MVIRQKKTGNEKEPVLVYFVLVYFAVALLEMAEFGGTDAVSLKKGLDLVFESVNVPLLDYWIKLMSAISNGGNLNLGICSWALNMMKENRPWLVTIHYANHRLELALKYAVKEIPKFAVYEVSHKYVLPIQEFWQTLNGNEKYCCCTKYLLHLTQSSQYRILKSNNHGPSKDTRAKTKDILI